MRRHLMASMVAALFVGALLTPTLRAADLEFVGSDWMLTPETGRSHPSVWVGAAPVVRDLILVSCGVSYQHDRLRFDLVPPYDPPWGYDVIPLPQGGRIEATVEVATEAGATRVIEGAEKVKRTQSRRRTAELGWIDPSGGRGGFEPTEELPVRVHAGDVLLFSLRFSKMPDLLGIERTEDTLRRDRVAVFISCETCGSKDSPCPDPGL